MAAQRSNQGSIPAHKFAVGQRVHFSPDVPGGGEYRGVYIVVRRMPSETREPQYRIKDTRDGQERAARESQLGHA